MDESAKEDFLWTPTITRPVCKVCGYKGCFCRHYRGGPAGRAAQCQNPRGHQETSIRTMDAGHLARGDWRCFSRMRYCPRRLDGGSTAWQHSIKGLRVLGKHRGPRESGGVVDLASLAIRTYSQRPFPPSYFRHLVQGVYSEVSRGRSVRLESCDWRPSHQHRSRFAGFRQDSARGPCISSQCAGHASEKVRSTAWNNHSRISKPWRSFLKAMTAGAATGAALGQGQGALLGAGVGMVLAAMASQAKPTGLPIRCPQCFSFYNVHLSEPRMRCPVCNTRLFFSA